MADAPLILRGPRAHSVKLVLEDGYLTAEWSCHATEGADCRMSCPEGCEEWTLDGEHEHKLVDYGSCLMVEFLENMSPEEAFLGTSVLYEGPFEHEWDSGYTIMLPAVTEGPQV